MLDLSTAFAKFERACAHLTVFEAEVASFLAFNNRSGPNPVRRGDEVVFVLRVVRQAPLTLTLIAGDVLTNTRAILDHAAFSDAMAQAQGHLDEKQQRSVMFRVTEDAKRWSEIEKRLPDVHSQGAIDVMRKHRAGPATPPAGRAGGDRQPPISHRRDRPTDADRGTGQPLVRCSAPAPRW